MADTDDQDQHATQQSQKMPQPQPRPFAQAVELTIATYDQAARNYAERNAEPRSAWTEQMARFVDLLDEARARRPIPDLGRPGDDITLDEYLNFVPVLDAGCGPGRDARVLAAYGLPVLGVDLSQGMLDEAGERTARRLPTGFVRYALMDLRRLELPDASCRGVWAAASLLHLPKRVASRAMAELARVLRPGGPLALFLKRREGEQAEEEMQPYPFGEVTTAPRFFAYYTPDEVRALVEGAGLEVLEQEVLPDGRPGAPSWVAILARKP
ncbi:MAG TPA: class I SAM-dependent methyltransferase [Ktedonobacterales bacterium]|nr:class I SAM-dependent methyltransferase [Ktedonobacterales bacterium]